MCSFEHENSNNIKSQYSAQNRKIFSMKLLQKYLCHSSVQLNKGQFP